ncbi:hypothetical protein CDES_14130 [Corynebacterium deserti GIMN1.010]|uniref:N-acetyltransferase domain-containing protein n=1 Tax=Corynebacterium deserti GIMN1.010 TaxID=931089 RepID=A0A0M3QAB0_9CORY|nr:hypothetical protein [Corynebacterium deserti]ALC07149.1 hypothetical protein CDES_14130 [Corynebacterium deserti GIMN1.010]
MHASLFPIVQEQLEFLHPQARRSAFWELAPEVAEKADPEFEKEAWLTTMLLEKSSCGFNIGYNNGTPALASVIFCERDAAPGAQVLPTAPVSKDAAIISSLFIDEVFRGVGMESALLDAALMELIKQDYPAVEAFGLRAEAPQDPIASRRIEIGLIDFDALESAGFEVVADHPVLPRLRMELPPASVLMSARDAELLLQEMGAI